MVFFTLTEFPGHLRSKHVLYLDSGNNNKIIIHNIYQALIKYGCFQSAPLSDLKLPTKTYNKHNKYIGLSVLYFYSINHAYINNTNKNEIKHKIKQKKCPLQNESQLQEPVFFLFNRISQASTKETTSCTWILDINVALFHDLEIITTFDFEDDNIDHLAISSESGLVELDSSRNIWHDCSQSYPIQHTSRHHHCIIDTIF